MGALEQRLPYFVVVGLAALASIGSAHVTVGKLGEFRSVSGLARPVVLVVSGLVLCRFAPALARHFSTEQVG